MSDTNEVLKKRSDLDCEISNLNARIVSILTHGTFAAELECGSLVEVFKN